MSYNPKALDYDGDGSLLTGVVHSTKLPGYCLHLGSNGNYATLSNMDPINGVTKYSFCFWFQQDIERIAGVTSPLNQALFCYTQVAATINGIYCQTHLTNRSGILVGTTDAIYGQCTYSEDPRLWNHVAVVYDGTLTGNANRLKIYVNGVQRTVTFVGTIQASLPNPGNTTALLGRLNSYGEQLYGRLDEVAVFNGTALSDAKVLEYYGNSYGHYFEAYKFTGSETGLSNLFSFDEGNGITPIDDKGSAIGAFVTSGTDIPYYREGKVMKEILP